VTSVGAFDGHGRPERANLRVVGDAGPANGYTDWDGCYRDNVGRVYRMLYSKVGNRADAEDLTTEVFLAAWRPLRLDVSRAEIRAYLGATARTALAGFWRRRAAVEVTSISASDVTSLVDDEPPGADGPSLVAPVLAGLPDRYRRILELRFLEGCSVKESAREIGVSIANAKVLQHRALRMAAVSMNAGHA
jgi:RNA polymerase sigma-70 factor (ECF subfamily)